MVKYNTTVQSQRQNNTPSISYQNRTYLFNISDIPSHSQYIDQALPAIQRAAQSGGILVVDCIEGITREVEFELEYAIKAQLPLVLVLNKFDRFVTELRIPPNDVYFKLLQLIESLNALILSLHTLYHGPNANGNGAAANTQYKCPFFSPIENNVVFLSVLHCYAFTLQSFAETFFYTNRHDTVYSERDIKQFSTLLWGNIFYDARTKEFVKKRSKDYQSRSFVEFVLNPLYKLYSACLTGDENYIINIMTDELQINERLVNHDALKCGHDELFRDVIGKWLFHPLYTQYDDDSLLYTNAYFTAALLTTTISRVLPPPIYRKASFQLQDLLYRPNIVLNNHYEKSTQAQLTQTGQNGITKNVFKNTIEHFPPSRVSLAELLSVLPHPNGKTFDYICRIHTLSINNNPKDAIGHDLATREKLDMIPAFKLGDTLTMHATQGQKYTYPHLITAMYTPSSYRYRIPITKCFDNNIVIFSFEQPAEGSDIEATINNQVSLPSQLQHATFINNTITDLKTLQQFIPQNDTAMQIYIPTFLPPEVHTGNNILHISIEPTKADELPLLLSALSRAQSIYGPSLTVVKQNTGCHTIQTRGEFIADDIIQYLRTINTNLFIAHQNTTNLLKLVPSFYAQLSFSVSTPFYEFREGVGATSEIPATCASMNDLNIISANAAEATIQVPVDPNRPNGADSVPKRGAKSAQRDQTASNFIPDYLMNKFHHLQYKNWYSTNDTVLSDQQQHIENEFPTSLNHINRLATLQQKYGWDQISSSMTPWSFGLLQDANVSLYDGCSRSSLKNTDIFGEQESLFYSGGAEHQTAGQWSFDSIASIVNGFNGVTLQGPLTESPLHNTTITLTEMAINKNPLKSGTRYLIPTIRKAINGAVLLAHPIIYEPVVMGEIITKENFEQIITKTLEERRGLITARIPIPATQYQRYIYKLPALESMGFSIDIKVHTQGQSRISSYHHAYQAMEGDPLDQSIPTPFLQSAPIQHLPHELVVKTRRKRGLPEFTLDQYFDQALLDMLQNAGEEEE